MLVNKEYSNLSEEGSRLQHKWVCKRHIPPCTGQGKTWGKHAPNCSNAYISLSCRSHGSGSWRFPEEFSPLQFAATLGGGLERGGEIWSQPYLEQISLVFKL